MLNILGSIRAQGLELAVLELVEFETRVRDMRDSAGWKLAMTSQPQALLKCKRNGARFGRQLGVQGFRPDFGELPGGM